MSTYIIEALKALSRDNHDPKFPPASFRELPQVRTDSEQQLRICNAEIMRMECLLERFYIQREALETQLGLVSSLHAPIRRLPVPILQDILIETESTKLRSMVLSHVCTHWRRVIDDTPLFRSQLDLDIPMWCRPDSYDDLRHFLAQSRDHPLSITIGLGDQQALPVPEAVRDAVFALSEQWGSLRTKVKMLSEFANLRCSSLRALSVFSRDYGRNRSSWEIPFSPSEMSISCSSLPNTPLLTSASLHGVHPRSVDVPWEQLSSLKVDSATLDASDIRAISRCHRLQYLELSQCQSELTEDGNEWQLPIKTLAINARSRIHSMPCCPNLTTFHLNHVTTSPWGRIHDHALSSYELKELLHPYEAQIESLYLESPGFSPHFHSLMSALDRSQSDMFLPNLKELSFGLDGASDETVHSLISSLHARVSAGFKCLKLRFLPNNAQSYAWGNSDPTGVPLPLDLTPLRSLVNEGVQVMIMHEDRYPYLWSTQSGNDHNCGVWHVLQAGGHDGDDEATDEIGCPFIRTHVLSDDTYRKRWRPVDFLRYC